MGGWVAGGPAATNVRLMHGSGPLGRTSVAPRRYIIGVALEAAARFLALSVGSHGQVELICPPTAPTGSLSRTQ